MPHMGHWSEPLIYLIVLINLIASRVVQGK